MQNSQIIKLIASSLFTISLSTSVVAAERIVHFAISGNNYCDSNHVSEITFNVSNLGNTPTLVTVFLYRRDGTSMVQLGTNNNGIFSTITPGTPFNLGARTTEHYHLPIGGPSTIPCSDRVFSGKIVVDSLDSVLLASGWVTGRRYTADTTMSAVPITVNESKPF